MKTCNLICVYNGRKVLVKKETLKETCFVGKGCRFSWTCLFILPPKNFNKKFTTSWLICWVTPEIQLLISHSTQIQSKYIQYLSRIDWKVSRYEGGKMIWDLIWDMIHITFKIVIYDMVLYHFYRGDRDMISY